LPSFDRAQQNKSKRWLTCHYICQSMFRNNTKGFRTDSHVSCSSIADFLVFPAFRYANALTIVSFLHSWNRPSEYAPRIRQHPRGDWTNILGGIVSSIPAAPFSSREQQYSVILHVLFLMSLRSQFTSILHESMRVLAFCLRFVIMKISRKRL